jgi:hypothetical protein
MTTQLTIDDIFTETEVATKTTPLVVNKLTTIEWNIVNYLKANHVSRANAISAEKLSELFSGMDERQLRKHVARIREHQNVIVSSCGQGYYIPTIDEQRDANRTLVKHALSEIDTVLNNNPKLIGIFYKHLNEKVKTLDMATQNQLKMQFNGWEREVVNYFGDKYVATKDKEGK